MENSAQTDKPIAVLDYVAMVLIGIATILGALCAFYASLWGGVMTGEAQKALFELSKSNTDYLDALSTRSNLDFQDFKDDYLYLEWKKAVDKKDFDDADYLVSKMSPELSTIMSSNDKAVQEKAYADYSRRLDTKGVEIEKKVKDSSDTLEKTKGMMKSSQDANTNGDRFTFAVVLFTIVLFFGGMTGISKRVPIKRIYIVLALAAFAYSLFSMLMTPFPPA